ncbi:MAG: helix-turn-helix domain-containing protein [Acidiferrobacterales bacterium]
MKPKPFPETPQTIGEHIRRCRLRRHLTLQEAAEQLGVDPATVHNWEKNKTSPAIELVPTAVRFLGYNPFPEPRSLPERLLAKRRGMGWSIKEAARELGVDQATWAGWESGAIVPRGQYRELFERFLDKR